MPYRYENLYIMHYGVGHDKGGHSGRYPWGSGKNASKNYGGVDTRIDKKIFIQNHQRIDADCLEIAKKYMKSTGKSITPDEMRYIKNNMKLIVRGANFAQQLLDQTPTAVRYDKDVYQLINDISMNTAHNVSSDINITKDDMKKYEHLNSYIGDYVENSKSDFFTNYYDPDNTYKLTINRKDKSIEIHNSKSNNKK